MIQKQDNNKENDRILSKEDYVEPRCVLSGDP